MNEILLFLNGSLLAAVVILTCHAINLSKIAKNNYGLAADELKKALSDVAEVHNTLMGRLSDMEAKISETSLRVDSINASGKPNVASNYFGMVR